ncbi:AmmeMemoRadiSam system protein B [Pleionea sediminis]|uniref:AmmeMemoRadiSam system protein B n=1 Tax=Pleionea sediminis TaxID=2569479 RepID=UPI001184B3AB|nr:AmmeMemoRadiSam system protein B [Pleionea sediminis]
MRARHPAVAGMFYPDQADLLRQEVKKFLSSNSVETGKNQYDNSVKAIIAPHAGYIYSGAVAGKVYRYLYQNHDSFNRIILLGPAHRVPFKGIVHAQCQFFETPLGNIKVDIEALEKLEQQGLIEGSSFAHRDEHCLEVQLPFIQNVLGDEVAIVPLLVGDASPEQVRLVLDALWRPGDLIVVSSDLSHYLPYDEAVEKDRFTSQKICDMNAQLTGNEACGCRPISGLLLFSQQQGWHVDCVELKNSGDTAGDKSRVVGYGAYVCY